MHTMRNTITQTALAPDTGGRGLFGEGGWL